MVASDTVLQTALACLAARDTGAALRLLLPARAADPANADIVCAIADAHQIAGRLDEAVVAYGDALRLGSTSAWPGLGAAQLSQHAYGAAAGSLRRAIAGQPAPESRYRLGSALFELGLVDAAVEQFRLTIAAGDPALAAMARRSLACIIPGAAAATHADILAARQAWLGVAPSPVRLQARRQGKLRVGYLSAFFGKRNWMKPVWGVINHHDRSRFEIHMFSDGGDPSAESGYRDYDFDVIYPLHGLDNARVAGIIADAGIDVLVDLNGYSAQDRLAVPITRPAPVIVGWFNMFATTGSPAFDWLVGDAAVIRAGEEASYSERIHRVPSTYLAFQMAYPTPDIGPPPALRRGHLTFGCLGSQYKLTDAVLAAWGRILRGAPDAALLVRNAALSDVSTRADLLARLAAEGVAEARVTLLGGADHDAFLATYADIDVALDTFPYNGGTTTTEALWQGVPVLTFDGDRWASRTSRSLLLAAGLGDWVMADFDAYVDRAAALANDPATPQRLATLRAGLRERLRASPACDSAGLCRALEAFYVQASQRSGSTTL